MGRNLDEVLNKLPAARRARITALSEEKIEDMLAHAANLTDFRKAVDKTQAQVAKGLGINQNAVSQLEKRSDTYVSTLRRYLKSLDLTLELSVVDKNGVRTELPNFLQWPDSDEEASSATLKRPVRRSSTKATAATKTIAKASSAKKAVVAKKSPAVPAKKQTAARPKGLSS